MSKLYYAIEINTGETGYTVPAIGLTTDGYMRFITGQPGYDGTPTYPVWEDDSNNTDVWYEGFLIKDAISTATRIIDIERGGDYSTISGVNFSLENSMKMWNELQTREIVIINSEVKIYCVISDKFYSVWSGIIDNDPYTESTSKFICKSNYRTIHKEFPPKQISNTLFPNARKSSYGKTIPVCLGNIPYAKLTATNAKDTRAILDYGSDQTNENNELRYAAAVNYNYNSTDGYFLDLVSFQKYFEEDYFKDFYLIVASGEDAETDRLIHIAGNDASIDSTASGKDYIKTRLYLSSSLGEIVIGTFNSDYAYEFNSLSNPKSGVDQIWFFALYQGKSGHLVSNAEIDEFKKDDFGQYRLYNYDSDQNSMVDVHGLFMKEKYINDRQYLDLLSNEVTKNGEITYTAIYGGALKICNAYNDTITISDLANITDMTNFTFSDEVVPTGTDIIVNNEEADAYELTARMFNLDLDRFDLRSSENIFIGIDISVKVLASLVNYRFGAGIRFHYVDQYDNIQYLSSDIGVNFTLSEYGASGAEKTFRFNFLPPDYYKVDSTGYYYKDSDFGRTDRDGNKISDYIKLPEELVELLKQKIAKRVILSLTFSSLDVSYTEPVSLTINKIDVHQCGVFAYQKTETGTDSLYTTIGGGEVRNGLGDTTNSVYGAIYHILNGYDGITDVDYDNLSTTRNLGNGWDCGYQIDAQKPSFNYLKELCQYSFIGMFQKRSGQLRAKAWLEDTTVLKAFDESNIIRDSLGDLEKTNILNCFNSFKIFYGYNNASKQFDRSLSINKITESAFPDYHTSTDGAASEITTPNITTATINPDGSGSVTFDADVTGTFSVGDFLSLYAYNTGTTIPEGTSVYFAEVTSVDTLVVEFFNAIITHSLLNPFTFTDALLYKHPGGTPSWMEFIEGINSYADAKALWDHCNSSYLKTKTVRALPDNLAKVKWFVDQAAFNNTKKTFVPANSSPYLYLSNLVEYTTRQKHKIQFSVPIGTGFLIRELLDYVSFQDTILTNNVILYGWITKIGINFKNSTIDYELTLLPVDYEDFGDIVELGDCADTIIESGSQPDDIIEI